MCVQGQTRVRPLSGRPRTEVPGLRVNPFNDAVRPVPTEPVDLLAVSRNVSHQEIQFRLRVKGC